MLCAAPLCADQQWLVDRQFSPYASSEDIWSLYSLLLTCDDALFKGQTPPSRTFLSQLGRTAELIFFWDSLNQATVTLQHEVFGHGYRIRNIGSSAVRVTKYHVDLPVPYGPGGGSTEYHITLDEFTTTEQLLIAMAGTEASQLLAGTLRMKWMGKRFLRGELATLYLEAQHDLTTYVLGMENSPIFATDDTGDDMEAYLLWLNFTYPKNPLTKAALKRSALVNLLDPFTYYTLYSWFRYIASGTGLCIPMIHFGQTGYLPGAHMGLTPFGPEYYLDNYVTSAGEPLYFYARGGVHASNQYWGLGFEKNRIWNSGKASLGMRLNLFWQPKVPLHQVKFSELISASEDIESIDDEDLLIDLHPFKTRERLGGSLSLIGEYRLGQSFGFICELGYKTPGFIPGMAIQRAPIVSGGLVSNF